MTKEEVRSPVVSGPRTNVRVLHVIPSVSPKHGGPSYAIKAFASASKGAGIETLIATTDDDGGPERLDVSLGKIIGREGVNYIFFRRNVLPYKVSFPLGRWLNAHVREFDLVHIHALFSFSSFAAGRAARKQGVPYVVRPLGVLSRWGIENRRPLLKRFWMRFVELPLLRRAAAIHYTTNAERDEANALYPALAELESFIVPIPVAASTPQDISYQLSVIWQKFPQARGKKIILFLSRLDPKKGIELLLDAFARVKKSEAAKRQAQRGKSEGERAGSEAEAMLVIAGSGDERYVAALHKLAGDLKISDEVLWAGYLGPREKSAAFEAATVFVLPSYSENFGIAAAEALAAGVPSILSDQVALAAEAGEANAVRVVPCDANAIAEALVDLLRNPAARAQLAAKAKMFASERFSIEAVGQSLAGHYELIVRQERNPR